MNSIRLTGVGVGLACLLLTGSALAGSTSTTAIDVTCPEGPSFTVPSNTVTRQMNVMRDSTGDFFFDVTLGNGFEFAVAPNLTDLALTTPAGGAMTVSFGALANGDTRFRFFVDVTTSFTGFPT